MRDAQNLRELLELKPDFVGFIFWEGSKRFVPDVPQVKFPIETKRVGVFVDAPVSEVKKTVIAQQLDFVQLHGNESPEYCRQLASEGVEIIKAFRVWAGFEFSITAHYESYCSYFLFDTKGDLPGGNGRKFDWALLRKYEGQLPFFLSGGISTVHVHALHQLDGLDMLEAVDVNSGFEAAPGVKKIPELSTFIEQLRTPEYASSQ